MAHAEEESTKKEAQDSDSTIEGSLTLASTSDIVQLLCVNNRTGELRVRDQSANEGRLYLLGGQLEHVTTDTRDGLDALADLIGWEQGTFRFTPKIRSPQKSVDLPVHVALLEAVRIRDELFTDGEVDQKEEESFEPRRPQRVKQLLSQLLSLRGVKEVALVTRDGQVVEAAGAWKDGIDGIAISLARTMNDVKGLGTDNSLGPFHDFFAHFEGAVVLCRPLGPVLLAVIANDTSALGSIRHHIKPFVERIERAAL